MPAISEVMLVSINGCPSVLIAEVDGCLRSGTAAQFFADALVNQHVGVDGHAQCERQRSDAGQRERGL